MINKHRKRQPEDLSSVKLIRNVVSLRKLMFKKRKIKHAKSVIASIDVKFKVNYWPLIGSYWFINHNQANMMLLTSCGCVHAMLGVY